MTELSVLIPARNEMWLRRTVEDVLANMRGDTEVIVVLDGQWGTEGLAVHPRLTVIYRPASIGQRGATNEAARVSRAKYIMKLDAHCSVAEGFDVELIRAAGELGPDVWQVPAQYNFHVFDWVCGKCGLRRYQGPTPTEPCKQCGGKGPFRRDVVWKPRKSRLTTAWRFDRELKFTYWSDFKKRPEGKGELTETMSCLGACWFVNRAHYWKLGGMDENHGGWGQMGTEVACKAWLSGGRLVCNKRTWFAHMFRTQGGDFGFPWPGSGEQKVKSEAYSRKLWLGDGWSKAKRKLSWLIDHFAPVPDWERRGDDGAVSQAGKTGAVVVPSVPGPDPRRTDVDSAAAGLTKGAVYYSDCRPDATILDAARKQLVRAVNGYKIVSVTLAPVDFGDVRYVLAHRQRGILTMFRQILAGLELSTADVIFLCEHDILYHSSHFDFLPPTRDAFYYNENTWKVSAEDGRALHYLTKQTSGLCAYREPLLEHYRKRVALVEARARELEAKGEPVKNDGFSRRMGFEPGCHAPPRGVDRYPAIAWMSEYPNIDIRHEHNLTPNRWKQDQFRSKRSCRGWKEADEVIGWGETRGRFAEFLAGVFHA